MHHPAPLPPDEDRRLASLRSIQLMDTPAEPAYDDLVLIAAAICGTPMAMVSLVDADRQWFKAKTGTPLSETPRDHAFCAHTILQPGTPLVVPDAKLDQRFAESPLVTGAQAVRFYAGAAIMSPDGYPVGALCVLDKTPRQLSAVEIGSLEALARQVNAQMELRSRLEARDAALKEAALAQASLRKSDARLSAVLESAMDGIICIDAAGQITSFNRSAEEIFRRQRADTIGADFTVLFPLKNRPPELQNTRAFFANFKDATRRLRIETQALAKDGGEFPVELSFSMAESEGDHTLTAIVRDISERKLAEKRLQEHAEQLRSYNDALHASVKETAEIRAALDEHAIVAITDARGKITFVNDKLCAISKYSREELIGRDHRIINSAYHPKEFIGDLWATISDGKVWRGEIMNRAKDDSHYWVATTIVPFVGLDGKPQQYIAIRTDITDQKKMERELLVSLEAARAASRAKSEFLAMVSHEIRTPMNGMLGMTEVALSTELDEKQREYLTIAHDSGRALVRVVNDILDYSKFESGRLQLESRNFNLSEMVTQLVNLNRSIALQKGLKLELACDLNLPARFGGDPDRIRQVLENLLSNAFKFTEKGSVVVAVGLTTKFERSVGKNCSVEISIADTGIGIPQDKQAAIFEPFFQVDASSTRRYGGNGLGLALSHKITKLLGGHLDFVSTPGEGSTFTLSLPLQIASTDSMAPSKEGPNKSAPLRVLIAEDNGVNRLVLTQMLRKKGHEVTPAVDGQEALDIILRDHSFDVVLIDIQMPKMDGIQLASTIRCIEALTREHLTLVAVTANASEDDRKRCLAVGMDGFVAKPITSAQLFAEIEHAITKNSAQTKETPALVDFETALPNVGGDRKTLLNLYQLFAETSPEQVERIRKSLLSHDWEAALLVATDLSSASSTLGLNAIRPIVDELKTSCRAQDNSQASALLEKAATAIKAFADSLELPAAMHPSAVL